MTIIYLIRHGQASVGTDNYDVLSETGKRQSSILGEHLTNLALNFSSVYSGALNRQIDTATIALGITTRALQITPDFNEYNHNEIFTHYLPLLAKKNNEMAKAVSAGANSKMTFPVFTELMHAWASDDASSNDAANIESWQTFKDRIQRGLTEITNSHGPDDQVVIFTSGGVICTILHSIFDSTHHTAFGLNWGINNAGISRIRAHGNTFSLMEYNNITHLLLQDKALVTQI